MHEQPKPLHTPGPWRYEHHLMCILGGDGFEVATLPVRALSATLGDPFAAPSGNTYRDRPEAEIHANGMLLAQAPLMHERIEVLERRLRQLQAVAIHQAVQLQGGPGNGDAAGAAMREALKAALERPLPAWTQQEGFFLLPAEEA